jgi:hypothetical protein
MYNSIFILFILPLYYVLLILVYKMHNIRENVQLLI